MVCRVGKRRLVTLSQGVGPWAATKAALKTYLAANDGSLNPHSQSVMPSSPTIRTATSLSSPDNDLTAAYRYSLASGVFRFEGGGDKGFGAGTYRQFPVARIAASGANLGDGTAGVVWQTRIVANSTKVGFRLLGGLKAFRFIVDGRYVSLTGTLTATSSGTNYIVLDFGAKASREIIVENQEASAFDGVYVASGDTVSLPSASSYRLLVLGDSFIASTGATIASDGLASVAADYLVIRDRWASGSGGTGYVATNAGASYALPTRVAEDVQRFAALGSADIIVVAIGLNDIGSAGVQTAAASTFDLIRANAPRALVFVVGPWDQNAPSAPVSNYAACKSAIQAAMSGRGGFWFLDPQGVSYTKYDTMHPNDSGHTTLGQWLSTQIRTAIAA